MLMWAQSRKNETFLLTSELVSDSKLARLFSDIVHFMAPTVSQDYFFPKEERKLSEKINFFGRTVHSKVLRVTPCAHGLQGHIEIEQVCMVNQWMRGAVFRTFTIFIKRRFLRHGRACAHSGAARARSTDGRNVCNLICNR